MTLQRSPGIPAPWLRWSWMPLWPARWLMLQQDRKGQAGGGLWNEPARGPGLYLLCPSCHEPAMLIWGCWLRALERAGF